MKTIVVEFRQIRRLGLLPELSLVAIAQAYAMDGLELRWRRIPAAQSNIGYQRSREARHD